ncbi:MAG: V4R domain-containing protein [Acidobacteriota bacterium]
MNQLLDGINFEPELGRLTLQTARYLFVRPGLLIELQKALETHLPDEAGEILSQAAENEGVMLASRLKEVFSYSPDQILGSVAHMLGESGWGVAALEMMSLDRQELVFKVTESPIAEGYGPSVKPVCHYLLGLFQGASIILFEREVVGQEVQCAAKGDGVCRFVVSAKPF